MRPLEFKKILINVISEYVATIIQEEQDSIHECGYEHDWDEQSWIDDFRSYIEELEIETVSGILEDDEN